MSLIVETTTVSDSYLMKKMDQGAGITSRILQAIKTGTKLSEKDIEEQILQIHKTRISPIAEHVVSAFERGDIVLVYSDTVRVIQAVPFIVAGTAGSMKAYVFVQSYGTYAVPRRATDMEKVFNIGMKDLYALMEGAYITLQYYKTPQLFSKNLGLMKLCVSVYTNMFLRILNKEYALSLAPLEYNQVNYCVARFFLERLWEISSGELAHSYAIGTILNPNRMDYVSLQDEWESADIKDLDGLMNFLRDHFPRLRNLSIRFFTEYYMNTYKSTVVLGMDVFPYFLFAMTSSMLGSFIANQPVIYEILKNTKGMNYFYAELSKFL